MGVIRGYKEDDEGKILDLFNRVFNKNRGISHWVWQFKEVPYGRSIIAVSEEDNQIVGQCTLVPSMMQIGKVEMLGGQSIDAMVDKDYRRKGYYEKSAFHTYELAKKEGILFRYGFPSKAALEGILKKLGGSLVCQIPLYVDVYRMDRLASTVIKSKILSKIITAPIHLGLSLYRRYKYKSNKDYSIIRIHEFDHRFDRLWDEVKAQYNNMTMRSSRYLNWRIAKHPSNEYTTFAIFDGSLVGYIVLKTEERKVKGKFNLIVGSIVDLIAINKDVYMKLHLKAREYFALQDVDFAVTWMQEHSQHKKCIKKLGFIKTKSTIPFAVKNISKIEALEEEILHKERWHLMPIEVDFY